MRNEIDVPLCLDGRMLGHAGTGVSTYARILQDVQRKLGVQHGTLVADPARLPPFLGALSRRARRARLRPADGASFELFSQDLFRRAHIHFGLTGKLFRVVPEIPFGIMHWTYPLPLALDGWINVYAVHDVIPITDPELSPVSPTRLRRTLAALAEVADRIVTISDASLEAISGLDIFDTAKISNISLTTERTNMDNAGDTELLRLLGLNSKGFFLFSGTVEERKNIPRLLAAYERAGPDLPLVIVGPQGADALAIESRIASMNNVVRLPYQSKRSLDRLVANAYAVLFPSLAEGFGLPVLEAMIRGTPVLTSKIPAIEEVAGDAALMVDPTSVADLAGGIQRLAREPMLAHDFALKGLERAEQFTVELFGQRLGHVYQTALAEHHGCASATRHR